MAYADFALKQFFKEAQKEDWFKNTLFIFTADHTAQSMSAEYNSRVGIYSIPLIFYKANREVKGRSTRLAQQTDIFPSVIDYLQIEDSMVCFGNSVFDSAARPFVINYINDTYQLMEDDFSLEFDGEKAIALYNYKEDPLLQVNLLEENTDIALKMEARVKAIIQQYQEALINNQLTP